MWMESHTESSTMSNCGPLAVSTLVTTKPLAVNRLVKESDLPSGPPHNSRILHLSGRHVMPVDGCPREWSSYPSRLTGISMSTLSAALLAPLSSAGIVGNCGDHISHACEFANGPANGADASVPRSPGDAVKHTGTTGLSGGGAVFTEAGTTGLRSGSHCCLPPFPLRLADFLPALDPDFAGVQVVAG